MTTAETKAACDALRGEDLCDLAVVHLIDCVEATLLFHSFSPWDGEKATRWLELTGHDEATTKSLCDFLRTVIQPEATHG